MKYTIGQAAKATGRSKSLISKAIKDGRLSATRAGTTKTSPMEIDASELFRVFSQVNSIKNEPEQVENTPETPPSQSHQTASSDILQLATALEIIKVQRQYQDKRIEDLEAQLKEAKENAEEYRQELKSTETKLIGVLENTQAQKLQEPAKGFWKKVFRR
jgi:chromosome segregation ATPase